MSNPVLRFAIARENGYFKVEQVREQCSCASPANSSMPRAACDFEVLISVAGATHPPGHHQSLLLCAAQEAHIQRHRKRLISQGEIEEIAGGSFGPRRQQNLEESAATFEVPPLL